MSRAECSPILAVCSSMTLPRAFTSSARVVKPEPEAPRRALSMRVVISRTLRVRTRGVKRAMAWSRVRMSPWTSVMPCSCSVAETEENTALASAVCFSSSAMAAWSAPSPTDEAIFVAVEEKVFAWELMPKTVAPSRRKSSSRSLITLDRRGSSAGRLRAHSLSTGPRSLRGGAVSFDMNRSFS